MRRVIELAGMGGRRERVAPATQSPAGQPSPNGEKHRHDAVTDLTDEPLVPPQLRAAIDAAGIQCNLIGGPYGDGPLPQVKLGPNAGLTPANLSIAHETARIFVGEGSQVTLSGSIQGRNALVIIGARCRLRMTLSVVQRSLLAIGADTTSESLTVIIRTPGHSVVIGDDCMISNGVVIRTEDGHGIFDLATGERLGLPGSVMIGEHVWLGNNSRVGKGVRIGRGSILGQLALATGSLDHHSAYGGIPARKIKAGIGWSRTHNWEDLPRDVYDLTTSDEQAGPSRS